MDETKGVGDRIQAYLNLRGMTRKELAKQTGVTEAAISRYINGEREPKAVTISAIALALEVSIDDIMGFESGRGSDLDAAMRLVARNAGELTTDEKRYLINVLAGV